MAAAPEEHPRLVARGQLRQMLRDGVADGVEIERAPERLPERDEPFHLGRAQVGLLRVGLGRGNMRLRFLPFALLMEDEDDAENNERRHERQARVPLDVAGQIEHVLDGPREHHGHGDGKAAKQHPILPTEEIHW